MLSQKMILFFLISSLFVVPSAAWTWNATIIGTSPPDSGTWNIANYTSIQNGWIEASENQNISILSGGTLNILGNTTIQFNIIANYSNNITIYSNGNFTINSNNGIDNNIQSNSSNMFLFIFNQGSNDTTLSNFTLKNAYRLELTTNATINNSIIYTTFNNGSSTGINGITINPGNIADSRYTINIFNTTVYNVTEGVNGVTTSNRWAVINVINSRIGKIYSPVRYGITHSGHGGVIDNITFSNITANTLYLDRKNIVSNINCTEYLAATITEVSATYSRDTDFSNITRCSFYFGASINSNAIIHNSPNIGNIEIRAGNPNISIHDVGMNRTNTFLLYTRSNNTLRNIVWGTLTTYGVRVSMTEYINVTVVNETGTLPSGAYANYIDVANSFIIKKKYLVVNITDSMGNAVVGEINATDNSSVLQNMTNMSYAVLELPYIIYSTSSGTNDRINKSITAHNNYTVTIINSSYSGSPYTISINMSSNQILNINLGDLIVSNDYIPPSPLNLSETNSSVGFWINYTWQVGAGNITDSYNVSVNGTWTNGSSLTYKNTTGMSPHGSANISVHAFNSSGNGTLNSTAISQNTQIPNNAVSISGVLVSYNINETETLSIDANYTDADNDIGIFSDNASQWSIDSGTGIVSWITGYSDSGAYAWQINVIDGNGSISYVNFTVTVNNIVSEIIPPYETVFSDNFSDNNINIAFWQNNTASGGILNETNQEVQINVSSAADASYIATVSAYRTYNASVDMNLTQISNGNVGMYFQSVAPSIGTNAYVNGRYKIGVVAANTTRQWMIYYVNNSGIGIYWNQTSGAWQSGSYGIPYSSNSTYNITAERKNTFYRIKLSNQSGIVMETDWLFIKYLRNNTMTDGDYIIFGDMNTQLGVFNVTYDNFTISYNDLQIPAGNNFTTDRDAYNRLKDDICYVCQNLTSAADGYYHYSIFNSSQILGMENSMFFDYPSDPNNISFITHIFTSSGSYRLNVSGIPIYSGVRSINQPLQLENNNSFGNYSINGSYPNYTLYLNGTSEEGARISLNLSFVLDYEHWFKVNVFYFVSLGNVSGNITINGTVYQLSGFSSWEHAWYENNIDHGSISGTGEYYSVVPIVDFRHGLSQYYKSADDGLVKVYDGMIDYNGSEWFNFSYNATSRRVDGVWSIITGWNVTTINSSSGAMLNYSAVLNESFGLDRAVDGSYNSSRGIFDIIGNYTFSNGTIVNFVSKGVGYTQVPVTSVNPTWRYVPCTSGCQVVQNISVVNNGTVYANWTGNSSYTMQNVYFNITYPNSSIYNVSASLISGTTQLGIWGYSLGTIPSGTYSVLSWANDSRGVWVRDSASSDVTAISTYVPPTPLSCSATTGNFWVNTSCNNGTGNITNGMNFTNTTLWINGTNFFTNRTLSPHAWSNESAYAFNNSGILNQTPATLNTQIPNNVPVLTIIGNKNANEGTYLNFTISGTDADSDTLTCGTNATKGTLIGCNYSWKVLYSESGTYVQTYFLNDSYSGSVNETITVTINNPPISSSTPGSSRGSSISPYPIGDTETEEAWTDGRKDYTFSVLFEGTDGRMEPLQADEHGIVALNMLFKTPVQGTYTITISTYTDYKPHQNGSLRYFSIFPNFDLKPTSSIELTSKEAIELYQLYGEVWKKLPKGVKVSKDNYRFPMASFGVFAVKPVGKERQETLMENKSILEYNRSEIFNHIKEKDKEAYEALKLKFDRIRTFNLTESMGNIKEKDKEAYEALKVKLAWLVDIVERVKLLVLEKHNTVI